MVAVADLFGWRLSPLLGLWSLVLRIETWNSPVRFMLKRSGSLADILRTYVGITFFLGFSAGIQEQKSLAATGHLGQLVGRASRVALTLDQLFRSTTVIAAVSLLCCFL